MPSASPLLMGEDVCGKAHTWVGGDQPQAWPCWEDVPPPPEQGFQNPKAPRAFLVTCQEGHLWAWHPSPHRPAPGRLGVSAVRKQLPSKRPAEGVLHPGCAQWHVALHIAGKCISRESSPTQTSFTEHPQPQVLDVSTEMLLQGRGIIPGQEWRVTDTQAGARSAPHGTPALA